MFVSPLIQGEIIKELYQAVLFARFKVPFLVFDAKLEPSSYTRSVFDINFLKFCSHLSFQFLNGMGPFTMNNVVHEAQKKELSRN